MARYVFDTNIVSMILRRQQQVVSRFREVITPEDMLFGCPVVWYEVRRGLIAKDARSQLVRFQALFNTFIWQDYVREDWDVAAQLWVSRRTMGQPVSDADLLMGAFTLRRNAVLVTANEKDFTGLDVQIENWNIP